MHEFINPEIILFKEEHIEKLEDRQAYMKMRICDTGLLDDSPIVAIEIRKEP